MPARCTAGSSTRAIATTPIVVPSPSSRTSQGSSSTDWTVGGAVVARPTAISMTITTTLFNTGANAAAANRRRALSSEVASAVMP